MTSNESKLIICDGPKILRPKPKKLISSIKISTKIKNKFCQNPPCKTPISRISFQNYHIKNYWKNKSMSNNSDLNSISFEEMENDFKTIRKRSEMNKIEKELIGLLKKSSNTTIADENYENNEDIERSENQFYKNFEKNSDNE